MLRDQLEQQAKVTRIDRRQLAREDGGHDS